MRNGTVKHSSDRDFSQDIFRWTHQTDPGYYVYFGMWKSPFASAEQAKTAYREWAWEARHS